MKHKDDIHSYVLIKLAWEEFDIVDYVFILQ